MSSIQNYCSINLEMTKAVVRCDVNDKLFGCMQSEAIIDISPKDRSSGFDSTVVFRGSSLEDMAAWLEDAAQNVRAHINNNAMNGQMALIPGGKK